MIVYVENPKESTENLPEPRSEFSKIIEYKVNIQNQLCIYLLAMNN